jgi:hypothetical protein
MMIYMLGLVLAAGLLFILMRDRRMAGQVPPATGEVIGPGGPSELMLDSEESALDYIRNQLAILGADDDEIEDYIDWLQDKPRSNSEIQRRVERIIS